MKKILSVVITKDYVEKNCWDALLKQTYQKDLHSILIHVQTPIFKSPYPIVEKYKNCSRNRETARQIALASDADFFFFVDSDVVVPPDALINLMRNEKEVVGGWYKIRNTENRYPAGKWVADNTYYSYQKVQPGLVKVDCLGMGCALFSRKILEQIKFESGTEWQAKMTDGRPMILGECAMVGNRLAELNCDFYMDGNVVCDHIYEKEPVCN